ncbi:MAG: DUF3014 domain-containing protein [Steroidobacterales bacterium]
MKKPIWWVGGALIALCVVALLYSWWSNRRTAPPAPPASAARPAAPPAIANPVPEPQAEAVKSLPALEASDMPLRDALTQLVGNKPIDDLLNPRDIIRHIVATIDNLPRHRVAVELRPVRPVAGQFLAVGDEQQSTISPANFARYQPYVQTLQMLDAKMLATLYFRFYPLFQQSYQALGYPTGYFNDRLVESIDDMLATPDPQGPLMLTRPNVMYQYADSKLEAASAGQKLLMRMGPDNAATVKAKLRELRAELTQRTRHDSDTRQR